MGFAILLSTLVAVQAAAPPAVTPDPDPLLLKAQYVRIDPFHSVLSFSVKHFGFTRVRGHFNHWGGYILWDAEDVTRSSFTVVVHTGSVDTGLERRDNDLKSDNFFNAEAYPSQFSIATASKRQTKDSSYTAT